MFSLYQAPSARAKSEIQKETYQTIRSLCVGPPVRPDLRRYMWALFFMGLISRLEIVVPERQHGPKVKQQNHQQAGSSEK